MDSTQLKILLLKKFQYEPTSGQDELLGMLADFLLDREERNLFLIKGYAGTGKTTIVKSVTDVLEEFNHGCVLLAPTGRSAKVLSKYSGKPASTIHKKIYRLSSSADGAMHLALLPNIHKNTLFIVDEASMIANSSTGTGSSLFSGRPLLDDLMQYVFNGNNCRLILMGDSAQLPPVGTELSPALDLKFLKTTFGIKIRSCELTEVVRQEAGSGILINATLLRNIISDHKNKFSLNFKIAGFPDVERIDGGELEDALNQAYADYGSDETIIICRSNKRANLFNMQIRTRILGRENELTGGDLVMAVKNNYFWLGEKKDGEFIANGEMLEVQRVKTIREIYNLRFAEASLLFKDFPDEQGFDALLLLNTINSESPAMTSQENKLLYENIAEDYSDEANKRTRLKKIKEDRYYNALQIKFAWALTCHKSQGGQWKAVFVEQGYLNDDMINIEYLRWLYTALTRATEKVYLVNFSKRFFEDEL
jgi:exodeoxyribonuclease-5